jgi:hypothetical protein
VVFTGGAARVGPYVVPGRTPCLACLEAHRRDADPAWPAVAAQLVTRELPPMERALAVEAGIAAGRLVSDGPPAGASSVSVTLRRDSLRRRRAVHVGHPACLCRSLAGNGTADATTRLPPTTTGRAFARPA